MFLMRSEKLMLRSDALPKSCRKREQRKIRQPKSWQIFQRTDYLTFTLLFTKLWLSKINNICISIIVNNINFICLYVFSSRSILICKLGFKAKFTFFNTIITPFCYKFFPHCCYRIFNRCRPIDFKTSLF